MKGKKILSLVLSLVLMLNIALAVEGKAEAKGTEQEANKTVESVEVENVKLNTQEVYFEETMTATSMLYSTTKEPQYRSFYLEPLTYRVIPVKVNHMGNMYLDYFVSGIADSSDRVKFALVDEENLYNFANDTSYRYEYLRNTDYTFYSDGTNTNRGYVNMTKNNLYYLLIINYSQYSTVEAGVRGKLFTTGDRTLNQGTSKWTTFSSINKNGETKTTWFKVKPNTTGVMSVALKAYGYEKAYGHIRLYNSNKKALSEDIYSSKANFGVKKDVTYYLKIESSYATYSNNYKLGVRYGMTARTDRAIGKKNNAKTLKRKADATNTLFIASNSTSTDWYKFKVTEKRATVFRVNASDMSSGALTITAYRGSKKIGTSTVYAGDSKDFTITYGTTYGKADAGTYYVKVVKNKMASGKYAIRYLK